MSIEPAPLIAGAGPRPINTSEGVAEHLPDTLRGPEVDLVRDSLVDALAALVQEWEYRSDYAAAQSDPMRAIKQYLVALAADRGSAKSTDEDEEAFRERVFATRSAVTEESIVAGVNLILSPFTDVQCQLNDAALDRWFVHDGTDGDGGPAVWHSFVGAGPNYPDRLFTDDAANNDGYSRPNSEVGGARLYTDSIGRHFLLRVPNIGFQDTDAAFVFSDMLSLNEITEVGIGITVAVDGGFFVGDSTDPEIGAFLNSASGGAISVYRAIFNFVNAVAGQSIRWTMLSDLAA